ncbi:hypothetical protein ACQ1Q5_00330 [Ornithobacterium rhinotracheale]
MLSKKYFDYYSRKGKLKTSQKVEKFNNKKLTTRQYFSLILLFMSICFVAYAQNAPGFTFPKTDNPVTAMTVLGKYGSNKLYATVSDYLTLPGFFTGIITYIGEKQIETNQMIAELPIGNSGMFGKIVSVLTIFAAIGCAYRIAKAYLETERMTDVRSILSVFSYVPILVLFVFSDQIVKTLTSATEDINDAQISNVGVMLESEIMKDNDKLVDEFVKKQNKLDEAYKALEDNSSWYEVSTKVTAVMNRMEYAKNTITFGANPSTSIKHAIYGILGAVFISILAIPTTIMTLMVKILLGIGILGAKIVFLLAFIPGFEQHWKNYLINLLNIMLWIPIFNVIVTFIFSIIIKSMGVDLFGSGSILWLIIVAFICAQQAISLTTSAAQIIVQGSGSAMAGSLGALGGMSATSMVAKGAEVAAGAALLASGVPVKMPSKDDSGGSDK